MYAYWFDVQLYMLLDNVRVTLLFGQNQGEIWFRIIDFFLDIVRILGVQNQMFIEVLLHYK